MTVLHIDASMGVAGDMLLGAMFDVGADQAFVRDQIATVAAECAITVDPVARSGMRAVKVHIEANAPSPDRTWRTLRAELERADLDEGVRGGAMKTFTMLAEAEGHVHGVPPDDVHFHEVGSLDAIADVVGVWAALVSLSVGTVTAGAIGTGTGTVTTEHGTLPVPGPAVVTVLSGSGATIQPGPARFEACTPTGAALLAAAVDEWTDGPQLAPQRVGAGAGSKDPAGHANVTRVILGTTSGESGRRAVLLETNVDDLDPRLWPGIQANLIAEGASDAWLTAITMKKGRPAHTLSVLAGPQLVDTLAGVVMRETTAIGMRALPVGKIAAERQMHTLQVLGESIRVKTAHWRGRVVNVQPEWQDVQQCAAETGTPAKQVLAAAHAAAMSLWSVDTVE